MPERTQPGRRDPLTRDRVLRAAVELADEAGIAPLSMRKLAQELGVVPMALYKHVTNKEELLDGMVDAVVGEIDAPARGADWKTAVRQRILSARQVLLRHPWAAQVITSRTRPTPALLAYLDSMIGMFRTGGFSADLTHHVMHAMGGRLLGFTQDLFDDSPTADAEGRAAMPADMATAYPHIAEMAGMTHDQASVVGQGCDSQAEFEFALDLLLDGCDRLRELNWTSAQGG